MNTHVLLIDGSCFLVAYLMGSIPFGLILGKLFGVGDIRKIGSGNIGATNMLRTGKKWLAALTLLLDFAKGFMGVVLAQAICTVAYSDQGGDFVKPPEHGVYFALAAVLGHIYPIWLGFKGGKGVATTLGVYFAVAPLIGILTAFGWITMFYLSRTSSLAAIGSLSGAPILAYLYMTPQVAVLCLVLAILVIYKHKDNIKRLREGKEIALEKSDEQT